MYKLATSIASTMIIGGPAGTFTMLMLGLIELLKLQNIHYPPNVDQVFEAVDQFPPNLFITSNLIAENPVDAFILPEKFRHFGISSYFINNFGDQYA